MTNSDKTRLRAIYLKKRLLLTPDEIRQKSQQISEKIPHLEQVENKNAIACYLAVNNEPNIQNIITYFLEAGRTVVIPAFFEKLKQYKFVTLSSLNNLEIGQYQIPQPLKLLPVDSIKIELALLPGLAFSESGLRLGYGKGVYDRLLANSSTFKIGVCYDFQIINHFKSEPHDIKVDFIVSENRIIKT